MNAQVGFAVIYRWRVRADREDSFRQSWESATVSLMSQCGALGSRLHRCDDGSWVAYAQWPSREAWEKATTLQSLDPESWNSMTEAIAERDPPICLTPVADHLVRSPIAKEPGPLGE